MSSIIHVLYFKFHNYTKNKNHVNFYFVKSINFIIHILYCWSFYNFCIFGNFVFFISYKLYTPLTFPFFNSPQMLSALIYRRCACAYVDHRLEIWTPSKRSFRASGGVGRGPDCGPSVAPWNQSPKGSPPK